MRATRILPDVIRPQTLAALALVLLPGACTPAYHPPAVTPQLTRMAAVSATMLETGRLVYQANCAKCHALEDPARYDPRKLATEIIPSMAAKAKLGPGDTQAVLVYLLAARQLSTAPTPGAAAMERPPL